MAKKENQRVVIQRGTNLKFIFLKKQLSSNIEVRCSTKRVAVVRKLLYNFASHPHKFVFRFIDHVFFQSSHNSLLKLINVLNEAVFLHP